MEILHTTDLSREGNDCYIHESVSLIKAFDMYTVVTATKYTGHYNSHDMYMQSHPTFDYDEAVFNYQKRGGKL